MRICTLDQSMNGSSGKPNCTAYGSLSTTYTQYEDPESPRITGSGGLVLNQVDIEYQVSPLIPGLFNLITPPNLHKVVVMRAFGP